MLTRLLPDALTAVQHLLQARFAVADCPLRLFVYSMQLIIVMENNACISNRCLLECYIADDEKLALAMSV